jgi:hypothetical protein
MYRETAKEAMVYARKIAEEDANIASDMTEDLKQGFDDMASSSL